MFSNGGYGASVLSCEDLEFCIEINIFRFTITVFFLFLEKVGYGFSENGDCFTDQ